MSGVSGPSFSGASTDFSVVHEILRNHIRRGNSFSVLATLALPVVHEDPSFWRTCTYPGGLAAAAIASTLESAGETQAPSGGGDPAELLSPGELYAMLRRAGGAEDPLLRRVMAQLEDAAPGPSPPVDLAEVCAVLQESSRGRGSAGKRHREPAGEVAPGPAQAQQQREEQERPGKDKKGAEGNGEATDDALEVLPRLPTLPGSSYVVASFDDVGEENVPRYVCKPAMAARLSIADGRAESKFNAQKTPVAKHAADMHTNMMSLHAQLQAGASAQPHASSHATTSESSHLHAHTSRSADDDNNRNRTLRFARSDAPVPITVPQQHQQQQQRQRRRKFTEKEDDAILQGIARFAPGPRRFDSIFAAYSDAWHPSRTARQLYDHWRDDLVGDVMAGKESKDVPLPKLVTLGIAGFSGMFGWVFTHPFEMWKNTVMMAPRGTSQLDCLHRVRERGLFKGLSTGLMRQLVYAPIRLGVYPMVRDVLQSAKGDGAGPTVADRALAGALSGAFASCMSSPVEVCLVLQTTSATRLSTPVAVRRIYEASGIAGFWRGIGALASRAAFVGVSQVAVHDQVLTTLREYNKARALRTGAAGLQDNTVVSIASVLTALFYSITTMPLEVARVRMSSEASSGATGSAAKYSGVVQAIGRIAREEGAMSIYDSFFPYFCRCAVHTVTCFFFIEYLTKRVKESRAKPSGAEKMGLGTLT